MRPYGVGTSPKPLVSRAANEVVGILAGKQQPLPPALQEEKGIASATPPTSQPAALSVCEVRQLHDGLGILRPASQPFQLYPPLDVVDVRRAGTDRILDGSSIQQLESSDDPLSLPALAH